MLSRSRAPARPAGYLERYALMSPIEEKLHAVLDSRHTRDDFVRFVELLIESFNEPRPWDNATMAPFLAALADAAKNLESYYDSPEEAAQNVVSSVGRFMAILQNSTSAQPFEGYRPEMLTTCEPEEPKVPKASA